MKRLDNDELMKIKGGISQGVVVGITAIVIFILGAVVGYANPKECNVK